MKSRIPYFLSLSLLLACNDSVPASTDDAGVGEAESGAGAEESGAGEAGTGAPEIVECAEQTLDFGLTSAILTCTDPTCTELADHWHGLDTFATEFDLELAAECTVAAAIPLEGSTRWIFNNCTGDQIPADGNLALEWAPGQPLPLPLTIGQPVRLRYRGIGSHTSYIYHHGWSIRDEDDTVLAFHSHESFMPDPWLTEPIVLDASHQDCTPTMHCGGTTYRDRVEFRGDGDPVTLADGNAGTFTHGARIYDALVLAAYSGSGYDCGVSSEEARFTLAFVAR